MGVLYLASETSVLPVEKATSRPHLHCIPWHVGLRFPLHWPFGRHCRKLGPTSWYPVWQRKVTVVHIGKVESSEESELLEVVRPCCSSGPGLPHLLTTKEGKNIFMIMHPTFL